MSLRQFLFLAPFVLSACALPTLPIDGTKAALANSAPIPLHLTLTDPQNNPLDNVQVRIIRFQMAAGPYFSGTYARELAEPTRTVHHIFDYTATDCCAVQVVFSKPGYRTEYHTYALADNVRFTPPGPLVRTGPTLLTCENITHHPPKKVVLSLQEPD